MATIEIADRAGACFGVERALELVHRLARESTGDVYTLGPLIHNPSVVAELGELGVRVAQTPEDAAGCTLLLRTHGVTPQEEERAQTLCAEVEDATCPFVTRVHRAVERLAHEGYEVVVVGEAGHPEVEGIVGHAPGAHVVGSATELEAIDLSARVGVVVQTTQTREALSSIVGAIAPRVRELHVVNTICAATSERQAAATELAARVDVMVVIGGRNSANTRHLAELCRAQCVATHHIELPDELDRAWFEHVEQVGVTAGASTPQDQIEAVRSRIAQLCEEA